MDILRQDVESQHERRLPLKGVLVPPPHTHTQSSFAQSGLGTGLLTRQSRPGRDAGHHDLTGILTV